MKSSDTPPNGEYLYRSRRKQSASEDVECYNGELMWETGQYGNV